MISAMRPVVLAFLLVAIGSAPAEARFTVCNKSARAAKVALGHFDGRHWASEGWWTIDSRKCEALIPGPLDARYYYLYATDGASGTWDGGKGFCTAAAGHFSIAGRGTCASRGYDRKGFFEVDTGQAPDWMQSLSD